MGKTFVYKVFNDDEVLFIGTNAEFRKKYGNTKSLGYYASGSSKIFYTYGVEVVGEIPTKKPNHYKKKPKQDDEVIRDMIYNLERYGNTVTRKPDKYIPILRMYGIKVTKRPCEDDKHCFILERKYGRD